MGLGDAIRTLVANVGVQTGDINTAAVTEAKLGNSAVTTAKLADCAVTSAKIANSAGKWDKVVVTAMAGAATNWSTWTCTAVCTIVDFILNVTAASVDGGSTGLTVKTTGGTTLIPDAKISTTQTLRNSIQTATVTESNTRIVSLTAGGSVGVAMSSSLTCTARGTYFVHFIA